MRTVGIVQARLSSSRLPGKVLARVAGKPLLWHAVTRLSASRACATVVVATSDDPSDDPVEAFCRTEGFEVYRGRLDDVLDRYYRAAEKYGADRVVRVTADCPLLDSEVAGQVARLFDPDRHDYVSNTVERTYPDGLDVEVFAFSALARAWREAELPSEREHVTAYIWKHPEWFRIAGMRQEQDRSSCRWTVDRAEDLEFVRAIFAAAGGLRFGQARVLEILQDHPELASLNSGIAMNEGYEESVKRDAQTRNP